jgi:hypothetical protein
LDVHQGVVIENVTDYSNYSDHVLPDYAKQQSNARQVRSLDMHVNCVVVRTLTGVAAHAATLEGRVRVRTCRVITSEVIRRHRS